MTDQTELSYSLNNINWTHVINEFDSYSLTIIEKVDLCRVQITINYAENLLIIRLTDSLQSISLLNQQIHWNTSLTSDNDNVYTMNILTYACSETDCDVNFLKKIIRLFAEWDNKVFEDTILNIIQRNNTDADRCYINPLTTIQCPSKLCFGSYQTSVHISNIANFACSFKENNSIVAFEVISTVQLTTIETTQKTSFICNYDECNRLKNIFSLQNLNLQNLIQNLTILRLLLPFNETIELSEHTSTDDYLSTIITKRYFTTEQLLSTTTTTTISNTILNNTVQITTILSSTVTNKSKQNFHIFYLNTLLFLLISIYKIFM